MNKKPRPQPPKSDRIIVDFRPGAETSELIIDEVKRALHNCGCIVTILEYIHHQDKDWPPPADD